MIRLQGFRPRNGYPHHLLDPARDAEANEVIARYADIAGGLPLVVCPDGSVLGNPSEAGPAVPSAWADSASSRSNFVYDVAVVGAGPAGLSTAVYGVLRRPDGRGSRRPRLRRPGPAPAPGSRTILAFRPASAARRSPRAPLFRRRNSARTS